MGRGPRLSSRGGMQRVRKRVQTAFKCKSALAPVAPRLVLVDSSAACPSTASKGRTVSALTYALWAREPGWDLRHERALQRKLLHPRLAGPPAFEGGWLCVPRLCVDRACV